MPEDTQRENWSPEKKDYFDKLDAVKAYIARSKFALVETFRRPLSRQYKEEIRHRVPENKADYDKVDKLHQRSHGDYVTLRVVTLLLLLGYFAAMIAACAIFEPAVRAIIAAQLAAVDGQAWLVSLGTAGAFAGISLAVAMIFALVRMVLRWLYFDRVSNLVGDLAHHMSTTFDDIRRETGLACQQLDTRTDPGFGHGWPERAQSWSRIALWSAIRGDALDRYSTVVLWKMKVSDANVEWGFRFAKGILLIVCLFLLFCVPQYRLFLQAESMYPLILGYGLLGAVALWLTICLVMFRPNARRWKSWWHIELPVMAFVYAILTGFILWNLHLPLIEAASQVAIGFTFVMVFWWIWILGGERSDDLWTDVFCRKIGKDTINTAFYFDSFSSRVRNLVEFIDDKERNSRGTPAPSKD